MSWRFRSTFAVVWLSIGLSTVPAFGQVGTVPVVSGIFPPGATVGTTVNWSISGRNLTKVKTLLISGGGVEVLELVVKSETSASAKVRVSLSADQGFREVRLDGSSGVSNLAMIRIDRLPQQVEVEPNDEPEKVQVQEIAVGSAVVGVLKPLDIDHFRIKGAPGQRLTLDLETRRVGTSIAPVMTLFSPAGAALAQGRESRGSDRDCRMTVVLPPEGTCLVQVRDNVYGGSDQANYRLRVNPAPFATALFPLGGQKGQTVEVEVSGGNLAEGRRKSVALPDLPGSFVNPGDFGGLDGPVTSPGRLIVGDGPEILEPAHRAEGQAVNVTTGVTVNGRISQPGEIDLYRLKVKAGDKIRFRVQASSMGSWLDSVIILRDEKGATLAENDDSNNAFPPDQARAVNAVGVPERSPDSSVDYEAKADGVVTLEVADRYGDGGPEYGYRLSIGQTRADYAVTLLLGNANVNAQALSNLAQVESDLAQQVDGVFNLKPGSTTSVNFLVTPLGRPGSIKVSAEGLPDGVTAEPVRVRLGGPASPGSTLSMPTDASAVADLLLLKVTPYAQPGLGEVRFVATSKEPGVPAFREASATIGIDAAAVSGRPITRVISRFPIRIVGEARPMFVGPPAPPTLKKVGVPGPLLQGDQLDLTLDFQGVVTADDGSTIEAKAEGVGLATNTVISAGTSLTDDEATSDVTIHVLASIKAQIGPHLVKVSYAPAGCPAVVHEVNVEVKAPIEVRSAAESIFLNPGDNATIKVEIRREAGFEGEVELKLEGLPRGVKPAKGIVFNAGVTSVEVKLEMNPDAKPIEKPAALRVVGMARMPRGNVSVESKIRPMIQPRPADK